MSDTKHFIEDARKSFRLASTAQGEYEMARYASMGRDYINSRTTRENQKTRKSCRDYGGHVN